MRADDDDDKREADELKRRFGERCRQLRTQRGWSQLDMVRQHDVTLSYWQRIEGGRLDVRLTTLKKVAGFFGISIADLLKPLG